MGLLDAIGGGIAQAAQGVADTSMEQIKAQIDTDRQAALMQMRAATELENAPKLEAAKLDVQSKAAEGERQKLGLIQSTAQAGVADQGDELGIMRAQVTALRNSGYNKEADQITNRIDRFEDNKVQKTYRDWQMKHGDESLKMNQEQIANNLKLEQQKIGLQTSKLNLDKQDRVELKSATDAYITAESNFKMLDPKTTDAATFKAAGVAREAASINLLKYGIKVGGETPNSFESKVLEDDANIGQKGIVTVNKNTGAKTFETATDIRTKQGGSKPAEVSSDRASQFKVIRN